MDGTNGTTIPDAPKADAEPAPVNRVKGKVKVKKMSAFQKWHAALAGAEGGKESTTLIRKTDEGKLTIKIKGMVREHELEEAIAVAEEFGLTAATKTEGQVGKYDCTSQKTLADDAAGGFVEYCAD